MSIKNKIKLILLEKNMTQNELVERLNISKSTLSNIISGKQNATLETALDIAEILKEPLEKIFYKERKETIDLSKLQDELNDLVDSMRNVYPLYEKGTLTESAIRRIYKNIVEEFIDVHNTTFLAYVGTLAPLNNLEGAEKVIYNVIFEVCSDRIVLQ